MASIVGWLLVGLSFTAPGSVGCAGEALEEVDTARSAMTASDGGDSGKDGGDGGDGGRDSGPDACAPSSDECNAGGCADDEEEVSGCSAGSSTFSASSTATAPAAGGNCIGGTVKDIFAKACEGGKAVCKKVNQVYCRAKCVHSCWNHGVTFPARCANGQCPKFWSCTATGNVTLTGYAEDVGPDCTNTNPNGRASVYTPNATYTGCK